MPQDEPRTGDAAGLQHMCLRSACLVLASPPDSLPSSQQTVCLRCYVHAAGAVAADSFVIVCACAAEKIQSRVGALLVHNI